MELPTKNLICPLDEVASYIDGELDPMRALELETHFAECRSCANELNQQKQFLCELDSNLKHASEPHLPVDFARTIAANAESTVSGLRVARERFNAIFVCAGLSLFVLFALGTDASRVFNGMAAIVEQIVAVGALFGRVIYSVFLGTAIILRSVAAQVPSDLVIAFVLTATLIVFLMFISRKVLRPRRA